MCTIIAIDKKIAYQRLTRRNRGCQIEQQLIGGWRYPDPCLHGVTSPQTSPKTLRMTSFCYSLPHFKALSKTILALSADGRQIEICRDHHLISSDSDLILSVQPSSPVAAFHFTTAATTSPYRAHNRTIDMRPDDSNLVIIDTPAYAEDDTDSLQLPLMPTHDNALQSSITVTTDNSAEPSIFSTPIGTFQNIEVRSMNTIPSSIPPSSLQTNTEASSSSSPSRRRQESAEAGPSILDSPLIPRAEKGADDPNSPIHTELHTHTPTSLSRLFGARMETTPDITRQSSYKLGNANLLRRSVNLEGASLPDHLYTQGLLAGKHSDIRIIAFGQCYNLHRIILDRAPFFAMALAEPWAESQAREISLQPQSVDPSITHNAFDLALRRLYGCDISDEQDSEAVGLFAIGCWLEMPDIIDSAIESILRQLTPENLGSIVRLVTNNYYGPAGERILSSAKAMLCRDGWDMPLKYWDSIPAEIAREIVGGDGFFVNGEWERWNHSRKLLDRRLKLYSLEFGFIKPANKKHSAPSQLIQWLPRFSSITQSQISRSDAGGSEIEEDKWYSLYTHTEVEPFCRLLDSGIHYIHLEFEHLQYIRQSCDIFGLPVVPESVILNAIYMQLELRQRVVNAKDNDVELGLTTPITPSSKPRSDSELEKHRVDHVKAKSKEIETSATLINTDINEPDNSLPRKFYIPSADCNMVMGGASEPVVSTGPTSSLLRLASRLPNVTTDSDAPWSDPTQDADNATQSRPSSSDPHISQQRPPPLAHTEFPPFRFAASFPAPRLLKEKKRVYSRTVFYAGSLWNIYIQKMRSNRNFQLGVYLHRAKERDMMDELTNSRPPTSVDERIGLLEREMLLRGEQRSHRGRGSRILGVMRQHRSSASRQGDARVSDTEVARPNSGSSSATAFSRDSRGYPTTSSTLQTFVSFDSDSSDSETSTLLEITDDGTNEENSIEDSPQRSTQQPFIAPRVPALPPYTDSRPTIRTYFKIYSPSKAGRLLSVYESAPDQFDFSQSWGWRSSTLMLDEGLDETEDSQNAKKSRNSGVLRFCIVLGNL
jgi:hypothetical protein